MKPKLRCRIKDLPDLAARYDYANEDTEVLGFRKEILRQGYMTKDQLRTVARWKSVRSAGRVENNSEDYVKEVTKFAFAANSERLRIELLTLLDGVRWPTASVLLHFFHQDPYPIIDFRALWTVSLDVPNQYSFDFWWEYAVYCRELAGKCELDMRLLDKALWQYSRENQPPK